MIPRSAPASPYLPSMSGHLHIDGETCPWCEQDIPPEKLEEIRGRIAAKEHERARAIATKLEQQYEMDKAQYDARAKVELELERQRSAARESAARGEAEKAAEAVAAEKLAAVEATRQVLEAMLQQQKADAEVARLTAQQAEASAVEQLAQLRQENAAALASAKAEAEQREAAIRDEAQQAANTAAAERLAASEAGRQVLEAALHQHKADADAARLTAEQAVATATAQLDKLRQENAAALAAAATAAQAREAEIRTEAQQAAEAARAEAVAHAQERINQAEANKAAAEQAGVALQQQLHAVQTAKEAEIAELKEKAEATTTRIRLEAVEAAQALVATQLAERDQAAADARAKATAAEENLAKLADQQQLAIAESLKEQREVLEKAKEEALNAERAEKFLETQKLSNQIDALKRTLEEKTADELGEGAEVNLYEALRAEFPEDEIDRVGKGVAGGDVLHVVMHNGRKCGTIIYDSKNHKKFLTEHVAKLLADQTAANAEHAILSTHKFPRGTGQLHNQDGVLLANPARVVAVVTLIRQHMVQTHTLRLSSAERESKTAALYEFIVSEQCAQFFARIDNCAEDLLHLQVKEKKWHESTWKKQGEAYRLIQKVQADLSNRISSIIGTTAKDEEPEFEEAAL
jgi:hypothetical protein